MSGDSLGYIAALDVGTTTVRCQIIDPQPKCVGSHFDSVRLHYPNSGWVEIDPDELWNCVINVVKKGVQDADISMRQVRSLAISVQRATFITWRKDNGQPLHNFITWKDLRATELIENVNKSWKMIILRTAAYLLHLLSRQVKFGIVSKLKFSSNHVTLRLLWMLQNDAAVQQALLEDNLMFGTLDTWLLYKLTDGQTYVTDITSASGTGLYDPFKLCWSFIPGLFNIPSNILPPVVDNDFQFGSTSENWFGVPIKIGVVMADQSASLYSCRSSLKLTLGTGAFLNLNTGQRIPGGNVRGMYPLVGWKTKRGLFYMVEVPCLDAGSLVEWMISIDLISCPGELNSLDESTVKGNGGVYFVSAFSGLGPPINNETAGSGFIGIKPTTKKEHLIRAVLESIVYRTTLAYRLVEEEFRRELSGYIRVDGGVSKNNYICQLLADLAGVVVCRSNVEMATLGVAYLAGISCGFWQNKEETSNFETDDDIFQPTEASTRLKEVKANFENWKKAAERFTSWYDDLAKEESC